MRIMEIISGTAVNGAAVNCFEIICALHARGHHVTVVCRPQAWIAAHLQERGIDVEVIESSLRRWPTDELRRVARLAKERQIEVVHTHMSSASFFGVLLRRLYGVPACVATAHNRYVQVHWMFNDRVIAVSEATKRFHHRYNLVPSKRIDVIHNFINDTRFHRVSREQGMCLRDELALSREQKLIGFIGDIIPRKGLIHLIRAMPKILHAVPDAQLLCVGHPRSDYAERCRAAAELAGVAERICWTGSRGDVDRVLAALDVYVLPSLEENMPVAILEAMASCCPVVASAVGGIPECVVHEQTGLLVPPAAETLLADAVIRVLSDSALRDRWGRAGRQRVADCFSIEGRILEIENVFRRIAA
jgi:glycosyltransferase involved in cell wall biosynthesis